MTIKRHPKARNLSADADGRLVITHDPEKYMKPICDLLEKNISLRKACDMVGGPSFSVVIKWTHTEKYRLMYDAARRIGYSFMADELLHIADTQQAVEVDEDTGEVKKRRFDQIDVAMTKHRIDTRKWMLAKMLPKIYGERIVSEHVGPDGGPLQIAALDLKGLSTEELSVLQKLLAKANGS
jgi:hypothetical protein